MNTTARALMVLALMLGPAAASAGTYSFVAGTNYTPGESGAWDVTLTEINPPLWSFSVVADPASVPSGNPNIFILNIDGIFAPGEDPGDDPRPLLANSASGGTNGPWISTISEGEIYFQAGSSQPLQSNGSNILSGTFSLSIGYDFAQFGASLEAGQAGWGVEVVRQLTPEPGTYAMVFGALVLFGVWRRRARPRATP